MTGPCNRCLRVHCSRYELLGEGPGPFGAWAAQRPDAERECALHRRAWLASLTEEQVRAAYPFATDAAMAEVLAEWRAAIDTATTREPTR